MQVGLDSSGNVVLYLTFEFLDSIEANTPSCEDFSPITTQLTTKSFMRLAEFCNQKERGTCEWIFDNEIYNRWFFGCCRTLCCVAPGIYGHPTLVLDYERLTLPYSWCWENIPCVSSPQ